MKTVFVLGIIVGICVTVAAQVQPKKVDVSEVLSQEEFIARKDVRSIFKRCRDFNFELGFNKMYQSEVLMLLNSKGKGGTLFIIKWDSLDAEIYHENFRGSGIKLSNSIEQIDPGVFKSFIDLVAIVEQNIFCRQFSENEMSYYDTEFLVFQRTKADMNWAICSFNGREFKEGTGYPGLPYSNLVDFILLEFGGMR